MTHILLNVTRGMEDIERASLAFVIGNTALSSGQEATVLFTNEGVRIAAEGCVDDGMQASGFQPLCGLMHNFLANGGQVWVCGACANPRGISQDVLVEGAKIVGAATAVEALVNGAQSLSF